MLCVYKLQVKEMSADPEFKFQAGIQEKIAGFWFCNFLSQTNSEVALRKQVNRYHPWHSHTFPHSAKPQGNTFASRSRSLGPADLEGCEKADKMNLLQISA